MSDALDRSAHQAGRRQFIYLATTTFAGAGGLMAAWPLIDQFNPSRDVPTRAFDIGDIEPGRQRVIRLDDRPIFVRHRTKAEIAAATQDDSARMTQPEADANRVKPGRAAWLVVEGLCAFDHIVPSQGGRFGGWSCPVCGAQYDVSGRWRGGPPEQPAGAAANLRVPSYDFVGRDKLRFASRGTV